MSQESAPQISVEAPAASSQPERRGKLAVVSNVIQLLATIPLIVMMFHVTANAISRRFFGHPLHNTLELTQFWYLPLVVAFGFVLAVNAGEHTDAPIVYQFFTRQGKIAATVISAVLTVGLMLTFAWYTFDAARLDMEITRTGGVSGLTIWPVTFALPIAFGVMAVLFTIFFIRRVRSGAGHEEPEVDHSNSTNVSLPA